MTSAQRLKKIRKTLNHTQVTFSEHLGINQGSYSSIENGKTNFSGQIKRALEREFNVNIDWLLYGKGKMFLETEEQQFLDESDTQMDGNLLAKVPAGDLAAQVRLLKQQNKQLQNRVNNFARQVLMYERLLSEREEKFKLLKDQYDHLKSHAD
jgi:transcriptional regulator with XRE-family HTH domain